MVHTSVFLFAVLAVSFADPVVHQNCSKYPNAGITIDSIDVPYCKKGVIPCVLHRGSNTTLTISFTPDKVYKDLTNKVYGIIMGVPTPFVLDKGEDKVCNLGVKCPTVAKQSSSEKVVLDIKSYYPSISLTVRWELMDTSKNIVGCTEVPIKLQ